MSISGECRNVEIWGGQKIILLSPSWERMFFCLFFFKEKSYFKVHTELHWRVWQKYEATGGSSHLCSPRAHLGLQTPACRSRAPCKVHLGGRRRVTCEDLPRQPPWPKHRKGEATYSTGGKSRWVSSARSVSPTWGMESFTVLHPGSGNPLVKHEGEE